MSTISASTTSTTAFKVTSDTTGNLVLQTGSGPTTAVTIDTAQNMGLGVTPSAWALSGSQAVQVKNASLAGYLNNAYLSANVYFDSAGASKYIASAVATQYAQNSGAHNWYVAPSGTAGNAISFTQAMTLDASGNLGVGLSSITAVGSYKVLALNGTSNSGGYISFNSGGSEQGNIYTNNGGITISAIGATAQSFYTNGSERARIDSSGNFMVGATNASSITAGGFFVEPNAQASGVTAVYIGSSSASSSYQGYSMYYTGAGAGYKFYVLWNGTINAVTTTITAISDQRLKENIRDLDDGLDVVMALKPRKFDWKEGKGADIKNARGFIAQEFEQVLPDMISEWQDPAPEGEEPYKAINANLIPTLVKAIQEQQAIIETLTNRIQALENK